VTDPNTNPTTAAPGAPPQQYRKPRADLYTLLLAVALLAILVGILFLYWDNQVFEWKMKDTIPTSMISWGSSAAGWLSGIFG
jgi:hypothetical protein